MMEELLQELKARGASLVGFAKVEGLYDVMHLPPTNTEETNQTNLHIEEYPFGISIGIHIPKEIIKGIANAPTLDYYNAYYDLNHRLDELALFCENYLMTLGYKAYAQTVNRVKEYGIYHTRMPHKTVAVAAGLGWIGKSALLITKEYGSAIRLTSVLTNAQFEYNKQRLEVPCENCMICKEACPGGAITGNVWSEDKGRDWIFDALACRKAAREIAAKEIEKEITLCGKCIEVCPYTKKYVSSNL